ncbi:SDR family oxidoreductase [Azospirillum picis]|uniref:NAD(P)-dependent dehydrogenase (Short-subunit alcohol dehydrogenase family) n=1 Tax=Azospirillum picis TaxID=488438 RepID=A0ABU0MM00_9PROT|nr:SDR family oxidoreductase [Azospirillum picis]MBP2300533.1 NAD(P)-dependent dehydrogenase (short-subunit alcohol dehydrogenase family) [Azospirillum picis]MDQ0534502.1 NAD(P)-dependent dehydrogenase (short-subunit alcohol dehydrogenase family) [Azospirillum picis]
MQSSQRATRPPTLQGRRVLVIGGASGIGRAVAAAALADGARVTIAGHGEERVRQAAADLGVEGLVADLADRSSLDALFAHAGPVDHLVITAGPQIGSPPFSRLDLAAARRAVEVKLWGAMEAVQAALPHLAADGSVTLTSGLLSRKAAVGSLAKTVMNAAVEALGKALAKELAPRRVNVVSPGVTATDNWRAIPAAERDAFYAKVGAGLPVGRVGRAEEVAAAYLFAMGNGFVTGTVIDADGGGLL